MATNIEWASQKNEDGTITKGETWNPTVGCTEVSAGCQNCYAASMAYRIQHMNNKAAQDYAGTAKKLQNGKRVFTGQVNILNDRLLIPAKAKKPTTYFVNSMSDLFHESIPFAFIDKVFAVMMLCPQHTFQVLTKRTQRMFDYCRDRQDFDQIREAADDIVSNDPLLFFEKERASKIVTAVTGRKWLAIGPLFKHLQDQQWEWFGEKKGDKTLLYEGEFPSKHIWLGTSIENQKAADERGAPLYDIHRLGWVTWVSNEPMIGPVNWETPNYFGFLDWVVTGGESGKGARPMHPDWTRGSRDFCEKNKIPFFLKQWGEFGQGSENGKPNKTYMVFNNGDFGLYNDFSKFGTKYSTNWNELRPTIMRKVGKHDAGRLLDGKLHDAYPNLSIRNSQIS